MYKNLRFFVSTKNRNALNKGKFPYFYFNFSATSPPSNTLFSSVSDLVSSLDDSYLLSSSLPNVCLDLLGLKEVFSGFKSIENSKLFKVWYFSYKRKRPNEERKRESCGISTS
jgi:hypothetical protein